ncbi:MAG: hypothetical protein J6I42_04075 [Clostridia bacterium]|nr:hypothetical protein [Clostridia bacterium]
MSNSTGITNGSSPREPWHPVIARGILTPAVSALAHNASTIAVSLYNMTPLLPEDTTAA